MSRFFAAASLAIPVLASRRPLIPILEMLGPYNIDQDDVSVGGLSSGGFMATQFHVSHSDLISSAAIFAGGPYYCSQGSLTVAYEKCMFMIGGTISVPLLISETESFYKAGLIDSPSNLANDHVYFFSGKLDNTVPTGVVQASEEYYSNYLSQTAITTEYTYEANHCYPTMDFGNACYMLKSPYISDCNYNGAKNAMQAIRPSTNLNAPVTAIAANLVEFDQTPYTAVGSCMSDTGYIYTPTSCKTGTCKLHVEFHGCEQTNGDIGDTYPKHVGLNEIAESNGFIVLYPNAADCQEKGNPNGCWDWWGYTNADFANKNGVQVSAVKKMVDAIMGVAKN